MRWGCRSKGQIMARHICDRPQIQVPLDLRTVTDAVSPQCLQHPIAQEFLSWAVFLFFRLFSFLKIFFYYLSNLRFFNGSANGTGLQMQDDSPL